MLKEIIGVLAVSISLVGCSTVSYVEPEAGEVSRVRFASNEKDLVVVRAYENAECDGENEWMRLRNGFLVNSSPKSLDMPFQHYHKNAFKEFFVESESKKLVMFEGESRSGNKVIKCGVPISLEFLESNKDYELLYSSNGFSCMVKASEIVKSDDGKYNKVLLKAHSNSLKGLGKQCMTLFKKQRLF